MATKMVNHRLIVYRKQGTQLLLAGVIVVKFGRSATHS